jgi:D-sedoheptulose 7-phosphate isomerase
MTHKLILDKLITRYPVLAESLPDIENAYKLLENCYLQKKKLLICGNGGSASDAEHIVGELMKSFSLHRKLPELTKISLVKTSQERGSYLAEKLQPALRAIALTSHTALNTAFANDVDANLVFAQQVIGYGEKDDILLAISTSGNAENVNNALVTAKALGLKTIGLTGKSGGKLKENCDIVIGVNAHTTPEIQELHLPVYHALCLMLELHFFDKSSPTLDSQNSSDIKRRTN